MKKSMPVMRPWATMPKRAALMPNVGERRDAEHDEAHVGHRREGDEPLHVGLREAAERAVDDADDGAAARCTGAQFDRRLRAGSASRCGRSRRCRASAGRRPGSPSPAVGRLGVGVGQPGVEREHRHLDGEADEHAAEDPGPGCVWAMPCRALRQQTAMSNVCGVCPGRTGPGTPTSIRAEPNSV